MSGIFFFQRSFFSFSSRQKLDNFFPWIIFQWHSSTPGRKIMWGHGLCWPALKENMQSWTPCGLWAIPQIPNSLSPWSWVQLVGIPAGCCRHACSSCAAERGGDRVRRMQKRCLFPGFRPSHPGKVKGSRITITDLRLWLPGCSCTQFPMPLSKDSQRQVRFYKSKGRQQTLSVHQLRAQDHGG